jgi:ankyrin repeat protein
VLVLLFAASAFAAAAPSSLADAAEKSDRAAIRALLKQRADVNTTQADGMTALHWAAHHDDRETAELLVRAGANVKAANRYGVTPLSLASTNGNVALIELLVKAGADPNVALPGGETPLMTASRTGALPAVKALLAHGAMVDAKDETRGQTALMWAAAEGHAAVVQALIAANADIRARVPSGFSPLFFAVREGRLPVVRILLEAGVDVNETIPIDGPRRRGYGGRLPPGGMSALLLAIQNAHFELAAELLDAGANPNVELTGYTVLHAITAVRKPGVGDNDPAPEGSGRMTSLELVKRLAARGASLDARMTRRVNLNNTRANELGATPFFLAALTADAELMKTLVALGADPRLPNVENSTPLMAAAGLATRSPGEDAGTESEVLEAVALALELGADVNAVDNNGETAMHAAAYKNLPKVVKFLAARGAKIDLWNRENKFGWTPLAIAAGYRFGNFKPSADTEAAVREVMIAAGVTPPKTVVAKTQQIY